MDERECRPQKDVLGGEAKRGRLRREGKTKKKLRVERFLRRSGE